MYSVVMLMAMSQTPDLASFGGRRGCNGGNGCGGYVAASCWGGNGCGGGRGGLFRGRGCNGGNGGCWGGNSCCGGRGGLFHRHGNGCCGAQASCGCCGYNAGCGCGGFVASNCGCCGAMASCGCWGGAVQVQGAPMQAMPATGGTAEKKEMIINSFPAGAR